MIIFKDDYLIILFSIIFLSSTVIADNKTRKITASQFKKYQTSEYLWSDNYKNKGKIRLDNSGKTFTVKKIKNKNGKTCVIKISTLRKEVLKQYTRQAEPAEEIKFIKPEVIIVWFGNEWVARPKSDGTIEVFLDCIRPGGNDCYYEMLVE